MRTTKPELLNRLRLSIALAIEATGLKMLTVYCTVLMAQNTSVLIAVLTLLFFLKVHLHLTN